MKIFHELQARGLIKQTTNEKRLQEILEGETPVTFYIGFDPTADSLHVGHLLQLVTARRLLEVGHNAIILLGGATAMIGDPSGKSDMRRMLSRSEIRVNSEEMIQQIDNLLIHHQQINVVNNLEWFDGQSFLEFLREIGPHFSVNNMLRADCFKSRMEHGLSFLEFNYMTMQAFDFWHLSENNNCLLQIGGDDQWSNMLAGKELIHKKSGQEVLALTLPLLINSDGTKMGKTEKGAIWLNSEKTSVFEFFQFWRNLPDSEVDKCLRLLTFNGSISNNINQRKKDLALELTNMVHGQVAATLALKQAEALFESRDVSMLKSSSIIDNIHVLDLLKECGFAKSRTDARNLISNRGISINEIVLTDPTLIVSRSQIGNSFTLKKGKKQFCLLHFSDKEPNGTP